MRSLDYVRSLRNAAVAALALTLPPASSAAAQQRTPWVVLESHGDVTQQTADGRLPLAPGGTLAEGAPIRTGADGALVIAHGNDRVTVSANSAFLLPNNVDPATGPSILETLGTLLFKVEHTPGRRFEVDTPYLAAVVKGTVFVVTVGAEQMVHVAEGAVEVSALASHDAVLVKPGQTATLSSPRGMPSVIDSTSPARDPAGTAPRSDKRSDATPTTAGTALGAADDRNAPRLTQTLGDQPLDLAALTKGLVKGDKEAAASGVASPNSAAAGVGPGPTVSVGAGNSSVSAGAGGATETSNAAAAPAAGGNPTAPVNAVTPVASAPVTTPLSPVIGAVQPVVDTVSGVAHGASQTAKLLGSNNPGATGRKP